MWNAMNDDERDDWTRWAADMDRRASSPWVTLGLIAVAVATVLALVYAP
jgi:hypothetical protein